AAEATFTERDEGQGWGGIRLNAGAESAAMNDVILNCTIERVGTPYLVGPYAVSIYDDSPSISGTTIRLSTPESASGGIFVSGEGTSPILTGNTIRDL